jgi:hypothetical protein
MNFNPRESKAKETDRDFRHNGVLFKHSKKDFVEILSVHVLGTDDEGVNICARPMHTKSIRSVCVDLSSCLLGCFRAKVVFQAGFFHKLANKVREMTKHLLAIIRVERTGWREVERRQMDDDNWLARRGHVTHRTRASVSDSKVP